MWMCMGQPGQQLQVLLQGPTADYGQTPDSSWEEQELSQQKALWLWRQYALLMVKCQ